MGGGLLQLVAYGAQDQYLTGNPQITFFKMVYRRYTNFSIESIQQTFSNNIDFGKKVSATIAKNGDLLYKTYIQVTLPNIECSNNEDKFRWLNWIGHILIKNVDIEIGGQQIDKHYSEWFHIWNELTQESGKKEGYASMVGNIPILTQTISGDSSNSSTSIPSITLYIPLNFWFCRSPGLALPLIALQYHDVKINVEFRDAAECFWGAGKWNNTLPVLQSASLYCDYIYLDTEERRRFANGNHEYLIEQLQYRGNDVTNTIKNKFKLTFNHPVKLIAWVSQPDEYIKKNIMDSYGGLQWFNFTDKIDTTYFNGSPDDPYGPGLHSSSNINFGLPLVGTGDINSELDNSIYFPNINVGINTTTGYNGGFSGLLAPSLTASKIDGNLISSNLPLFDTGYNCTQQANIILNGHNRFSKRDFRYFNLVQPYQHCTNIPNIGINIYSFALYPEKIEPSGSCNFSKIDTAHLMLDLTENSCLSLNGQNRTVNTKIFALSYNILRISNGMGGLSYSN